MSLLARRHAQMAHHPYGDILHFGSASTPGDGGNNTATPTAVTPPASMVTGDLVLLIGGARDDDNTITISDAGGQTWAQFGTFTDAGGDGQHVRMFWCTFNGTWSANPSLAFAGTAGRPRTVVMHVFRSTSKFFSAWNFEAITSFGVDSVNPIMIIGRTTTHISTLSIAQWYGVNISTWSGLAGTGWLNLGAAQYRNTTGSDQTFSFAYKVMLLAQATDNVEKNASIGSTFGNQTMYTFYQTLSI